MTSTYSDLTLTIDLNALVRNYQRVQKEVGKEVHVGPVVKANAYGLGGKAITEALHRAGCQMFFVATLDEAIELRKWLPDVCIGVFAGITHKKQLRVYDRFKLVPVLNTLDSCYLVEDRACILHVDTGMNRLGVNINEIESIPHINAKYIMTHPACADEIAHPYNKLQQKRFEEAVESFRKKLGRSVKASFANSPAIFANQSYHFQAVRPGSCLYGINPTPGVKNPMDPVVMLTANILQVRTITEDATVGYGATYPVKKGTVLATIACGYADGYLRSASNQVWCMLHGQKVPVVGRVSMDLIVVDITSLSARVAVGEAVVLIGDGIDVDGFAQCAGTIGYEVLTRISTRAKRVYIS